MVEFGECGGGDVQKARVGEGELLEGVEDVAAEKGDGKVGDGARLDHV